MKVILNFYRYESRKELLKHQEDDCCSYFIWKNTLLAHEVRSRKTYEMIARCYGGVKRLGLCNKVYFFCYQII